MFADRTTARVVGALFIVATVTAIVGGVLAEESLKRSMSADALARNSAAPSTRGSPSPSAMQKGSTRTVASARGVEALLARVFRNVPRALAFQ